MITLSLLYLLQEEGLGTVSLNGDESGGNLFFQKLGFDDIGVQISDIGSPNAKGLRETQNYELYSRGTSNIEGYYRLNQIRKFIHDNSVCSLPEVQNVFINGQRIDLPGYTNVELTPTSSITNVGEDAQGRIIYSLTGQIIYKGE